MYRFHSETNLIDIIHKFFLFLRSRPLQLSLRILFLHFSLTQTTSNVCVLCRCLRTFACFFFSRKNYKNIQKNNLVICVFLLLFESRDHVCGHVTRQKGFRARRIDYRFFSCLPKKCTQSCKI